MKILIDMNLSPEWCRVLDGHGHACVHWSEAGDPRAGDAVIMKWARLNDHVVLTHDLDFGTILAFTQASAPSVVQIRMEDVLAPAMEMLLVNVFRDYEAELTAGALVVLEETKSRVRVLPLSR